jgi:hypothetical protein
MARSPSKAKMSASPALRVCGMSRWSCRCVATLARADLSMLLELKRVPWISSAEYSNGTIRNRLS